MGMPHAAMTLFSASDSVLHQCNFIDSVAFTYSEARDCKMSLWIPSYNAFATS